MFGLWEKIAEKLPSEHARFMQEVQRTMRRQ
jgi:hypothetical protein